MKRLSNAVTRLLLKLFHFRQNCCWVSIPKNSWDNYLTKHNSIPVEIKTKLQVNNTVQFLFLLNSRCCIIKKIFLQTNMFVANFLMHFNRFEACNVNIDGSEINGWRILGLGYFIGHQRHKSFKMRRKEVLSQKTSITYILFETQKKSSWLQILINNFLYNKKNWSLKN